MNRIKFSALCLVLVSLCAAASPSPSPSSIPSSSSKPKEVLVSDSWYTVTIGQKQKYGYYNDRLVRRGDHLFFQNRYWKNEEGFINEEALGAISKDDAQLTPLVFNFVSTYRGNQTQIDGSIKDGEITVKTKKNNKELPAIKRSGIKDCIFSVFFPVWLGKKFNEMKLGQNLSYSTLLEDNSDQRFSPISGYVRLEADDEFSKKNNVKKITVVYRDLKSTWYILPSGTPVRIIMSELQTTIERVPEKTATSFFSSKT